MVWVSGDTLQKGKYVIEKTLGKGRFGITYRARHRNGERLVIKTLNDDFLSSVSSSDEKETLENEFVKEGYKLSKCDHKHIVKVGEPFLEKGKYYIAMEYIAGPTLKDRDEETLDEATALKYIEQIGKALMVVHASDLVHRDIKPENILIRSRDGKSEAVLIDFGLALEFDRELTNIRTEYAAEGYAPPELYSRYAGKIAPYTDVYSLAATLYDLLTGQPPLSAILRKSGRPLTAPIGINNSISNNVNQQILKGLELEPTDRPQSVRAWMNDLGIVLDTEEADTRNTKSGEKGSNNSWTIATVIALIAALGTFIGGLAGWIPLFRPEPSETESLSTPAPGSPPSLSP